jgi:hypothetical protein
MKLLRIPLALVTLTGTLIAGGSPGGPWANGAYYSGYLNGKYMGVVTGNNIAGVLGFAITDGAPPYRTQAQQQGGQGVQNVKVAEYQDPRVDITQNYFAIFVEGRTYTGLTTAGIDISSKTVAGALQGTDPIGVQAAVAGAPGPGAFAFDASDALSIINRGLSGGFTAKINCDKAVFTFKGDGQLSTPANRQSYTITAIPEQPPAVLPPPTVPVNTITNEFVTGIYQTETTPFDVKGIRTSFNAFNLQGAVDQNAANAGANAGGP